MQYLRKSFPTVCSYLCQNKLSLLYKLSLAKPNYFSFLLCPPSKKITNQNYYLPIHFDSFWSSYSFLAQILTMNRVFKTQGHINTGANLGPKGWSIAAAKSSWDFIAGLRHSLQHEGDNIGSGDLDKIYLWGTTDVILAIQTDLLVLMVNLIYDTDFISFGGPDNHLV